MLIPAGLMIGLLAFLEWRYEFDYSLGVLYTIPVVVAAGALNRLGVITLALACALIRGAFLTPMASDLETALRFLMAAIAYSGAGLLMVEMNDNRRRLLAHYSRLKLEQELRREAQEQLRLLAESSPAAVLTLNAEAAVVAANQSAEQMFGFEPGTLVGESLEPYVPFFANALKLSPSARQVRTSATGWAKRRDGANFPVQAWFSTYGDGPDRRLAAIVVDVSEELRDRDLETFRHLLDHNRVLAGAVSHEIRNLCSAISVVCSNLSRVRSDLTSNPDFQALTNLVNGLAYLASYELSRRVDEQAPRTNLNTVLNELRVVIEPDWSDLEGEVLIEMPEEVPPVQADPHGLLQIFLNLAQNSSRAVASAERRRLTVSVSYDMENTVVSFRDSGPGVANTDLLFQPFRPDSDGSGLGLYVSRALARRFGGDLFYVPEPEGCRFDVILPLAAKAVTEKIHAAG